MIATAWSVLRTYRFSFLIEMAAIDAVFSMYRHYLLTFVVWALALSTYFHWKRVNAARAIDRRVDMTFYSFLAVNVFYSVLLVLHDYSVFYTGR